jgi:hypothetical protein
MKSTDNGRNLSIDSKHLIGFVLHFFNMLPNILRLPPRNLSPLGTFGFLSPPQAKGRAPLGPFSAKSRPEARKT